MILFDRDILKVLRGSSRDHPIDLVGILGGVDALQRMVLSYEELEGSMRWLIESGEVAEAWPQHFFVPSSTPVERHFSGISPADYERAVEAYRAEALQQVELPDEDSGRPLVAVRWGISTGRRSEPDEDAAKELAEKLVPLIPLVANAEILGFEEGNDYIDILIWGEGTDEEIDQIYRAVAPLFRRYGCPPGSRLIRYYSGGEWELVSDEV